MYICVYAPIWCYIEHYGIGCERETMSLSVNVSVCSRRSMWLKGLSGLLSVLLTTRSVWTSSPRNQLDSSPSWMRSAGVLSVISLGVFVHNIYRP